MQASRLAARLLARHASTLNGATAARRFMMQEKVLARHASTQNGATAARRFMMQEKIAPQPFLSTPPGGGRAWRAPRDAAKEKQPGPRFSNDTMMWVHRNAGSESHSSSFFR